MPVRQIIEGATPNPAEAINAVPMTKRDVMEAFRARCTPESLAIIVDALLARAAAGDSQATKEVFDRLLGKPAVRVDVRSNESPTVAMLRARVAAIVASDPAAMARLLGNGAAMPLIEQTPPTASDPAAETPSDGGEPPAAG